MASGMFLNINRNEVEWVRLESERKGKLDLQTRLVEAMREGRRDVNAAPRWHDPQPAKSPSTPRRGLKILCLSPFAPLAFGYTAAIRS